MRFTDAMTGELLGMVRSRVVGEKYDGSGIDPFGQAKNAMDDFSEKMRMHLKRLREMQ